MAKKSADIGKSGGSTGRGQMTIDLTTEAGNLLQSYVDSRGGKGIKKFILSKLVEWFAEQPSPVKSALMGWVDEGMESAYAIALRKLADDLDPQLALINGKSEVPAEHKPKGPHRSRAETSDRG